MPYSDYFPIAGWERCPRCGTQFNPLYGCLYCHDHEPDPDMSTSYPTAVSELPDGHFYAVLYEDSVYVPSVEPTYHDPGGSPGYTHKGWRLQVFPTHAAWLEEVKALTKNPPGNFVPVAISRAKVETIVTIDVKFPPDE
jgi:hypothetical protein